MGQGVTAATGRVGRDGVGAAPREAQRAILVAASVSGFVTSMAITPVAALAPAIGAAFGVEVTLTSWLMSLYFLALTSFVLVAGRMGDLWGHARVFTVGIASFTAVSFAAGFSQNIYQLLAARGLQGLASALLMGAGFALIGNHFPLHQRGRAIGLVTTTTFAGSAVGVLLNGYLQPLFGWRWIFFSMAPLGLVAIWHTRALRRVVQERYPARLDVVGAVLIFLTLSVLSLSFNHLHSGPETFADGWRYHLPMHALTLLLLGALIAWELHTPTPLINLKVFHNGPFSFSVTANGICHSAMMGSSFAIPFLTERGLGFDPRLTAGLLVVMNVSTTISGLGGGWLHDRFRSALLAPLAMGGVAGSLAGMALLAQGITYPELLGLGLVTGTCMGIYITVNNVSIISAVPSAMRGLASGMEQCSRQLGHTLGVTATALALSSALPRELPGVLKRLALAAPPEAYVLGYQRAVLVLACLAATGALISCLGGQGLSLLPRRPRPRGLTAEPATAGN